MKAVVIATSGDPQVLQVQEVENPEIGDDEVLIRVDGTPLPLIERIRFRGRACTLPQRLQSPAGIIEAVGKVVVRWKVGDQVCALLSSGGHAEKVAVPAGQVLPVPSGVSLKDAAGIPEVACTVWSTVLMMSRLSAGETFLGGTVAEVNLSGLLARRLTVQAAGLRNRSLENKAGIVSEAEKNVWAAITGVQVFSIDGSSRG